MNVLITGATSGIGLEFAKIFAREGFDLILVARNSEKLDELIPSISTNSQIKIHKIISDLANPKASEEVHSQVKALNLDVDILINNAGFGAYGSFIETDIQKEREMMQVNMITLTELSKLVGKDMAARKSGKILNVASTAAFLPGPMMAIYYATKAYVLSFSVALAEELRSNNVKVTILCPGPTATNFQKLSDSENSKLFKGKKLPSAQNVAEFGYKALMKGKLIAVHGWYNNLVVQTTRILPRRLVAFIVKNES